MLTAEGQKHNCHGKGSLPDTSEKHEEFFDTTHLTKDLKGRSVRGGAVTMTAQGVKFFLQMGSTVVLARLLTPEDFGLIAMVAIVTSFVMIFKDMGLSMATVQKGEINHGQISTLFWINMILGLGVMLVTAALAPVIAWFYNEPRLIWITLALASAFIFGGLTVQHQALLKRHMCFGTLSLIGIIGMAVSIVAAIVAAWYGAGYWALVIMQLARAITSAIGVWVACGWRPGLPVRRSGVRKMLAFGGNLTGFNVMNYFARSIDKVLIGKVLGTTTLGIFDKANNLLLLPLSQIKGPLDAVAIPVLSRLQNDPDRYKRYYLKAIHFISFITMPSVTFMIVMSKEVIQIVLGGQWTQASPIFAALGLFGVFLPIWSTIGWLYVSTGQTNRMLRWGIFDSVLVVLSVIVGIQYGTLGVAYAFVAVRLGSLIPTFWYATKGTPVQVCDILHSFRNPLIGSIAMGLTIYSMNTYLIQNMNIASRLVLTLLIGTVTYLSVCCLIELSLVPLLELPKLAKETWGGAKAKNKRYSGV
jgi:O-antigen/teichoic acid export membrane protein